MIIVLFCTVIVPRELWNRETRFSSPSFNVREIKWRTRIRMFVKVMKSRSTPELPVFLPIKFLLQYNHVRETASIFILAKKRIKLVRFLLNCVHGNDEVRNNCSNNPELFRKRTTAETTPEVPHFLKGLE